MRFGSNFPRVLFSIDLKATADDARRARTREDAMAAALLHNCNSRAFAGRR